MVVLTSQVWGRRSQSWGRKPVLIAALAICMAVMVLFAVVATLGVRGVLGKTPLFVLFVLTFAGYKTHDNDSLEKILKGLPEP